MQQHETRNCQNCKRDFAIEPEDFAFYEKMKVPPPTFCPECRMVRRMNWRNERSLYKNTCAATGKDIISMFSPEMNVVVYDRDYWWSDKWDQLASGRDYDFSKPFFQQFKELFHVAPLPNLANSNCVRSKYGNHNLDCKDCYLIYASLNNENISYSRGGVHCKDSFDIDTVMKSEQCYNDILCGGMYKVNFSYDSDDSMDSDFLQACKNMKHSLGCINLQNKSYNIFNQQYTKEEYEKERAKYDFGSYKVLSDFREKFAEFIRQYPRRYGFVYKSLNTFGDNVLNAKNVYMGFDIFGGAEDSKYIVHIVPVLKNTYDAYGAGANLSDSYDIVDSGADATRLLFTVFTHSSHDLEYTYACHNSSYLFSCVGLQSKQYCILNKQYTKEEYKALLPKIKKQMAEMPYVDSHGKTYGYGEFFPVEISPFFYNETIAQEFYPISEAQASEKGYRWFNLKKQDYKITKKTDDIPDHIKDVSDAILQEVIECAHQGSCNDQCTKAFRIIEKELQFYKKMNFALPRLCPNCRHAERMKKRTQLKLGSRKCDCGGEQSKNGIYKNTVDHFHEGNVCPNEFQTAYSPQKPEMLYCQQCYNAEVI